MPIPAVGGGCAPRARHSGEKTVPLRGQAANPRLEIALTGAGIVVTLFALIMFLRYMAGNAQALRVAGDRISLIHTILFSVAVAVLVYGNLVYQLSRVGFYVRRYRFSHPPYKLVFNQESAAGLPPLTILVPSYKEDPRTIKQTLLSAALQDYSGRHVVLLIDDNPYPSDPADRLLLENARRMPEEIMASLEPPRERAERAQRWFRTRQEVNAFDPVLELRELRAAYAEADAWFAQQLSWMNNRDHTDALFAQLTFDTHRVLLHECVEWPVQSLWRGELTAIEIAKHYRRLVNLFTVEITSFERKRYVNLAHEPNKAANLNSYIGIIGARLRETVRADALYLEAVENGALEDANVVIPDAKYVITLDADSMLAPDYARRMVAIMESPGNERVAVAQSPYTAIPNPPGIVERIAGATTSLQYVVQHGYTQFRSTFWIGANALIRKAALDDICTEEFERGFRVPKYIQDRTVIEDTESTLDLVARGWKLFNYPERLAFSATPPDFGSLLIQRRRWSTGGLLILPKLFRYAVSRPAQRGRSIEVALRAHYLVSSVYSTMCLLFFLMLPVDSGFNNYWLPLTGVPYLFVQWRELTRAGYHRGDILRTYAFNLMLIPIQMAGTINSIQQAVTGRKIPFGRTPKVEGRTAAPAWAIASECLLFAYFVGMAFRDLRLGDWRHATFALEIAFAFAYAVVVFIGPRAALSDVTAGMRNRFAGMARSRRTRTGDAYGSLQTAPSLSQTWPGALEPVAALTSRTLLDDGALARFHTTERSFNLDVADAAFGGLSRDRLVDPDPGLALVGAGSARSRELIATVPRGSLRTEPIGD